MIFFHRKNVEITVSQFGSGEELLRHNKNIDILFLDIQMYGIDGMETARKMRSQNYKGYQGQMIKQADVNLLAYPLHVITDKEQIEKDLEYYAEKIDKKDGPAMASGVLSVLYARLGDREKAYSYFVKSYLPNSRPPFGVFSESANSNNPYFATGAGAMLQAVIYGFGGVEQTDLGLKYNKGLLPKQWKSLKIIGIGADNKTIVIK